MIPTRPWRRRWGRWTRPSGRARRCTSGISSYGPRHTEEAIEILRQLGTPLLIHQPSYSLFNRWVEPELLDVLDREGVGSIAFSPLAQGLLTDKYLDGIPDDSRVRRGLHLSEDLITPENVQRARALNEIAVGPRAVAGADGDRLGAARPAGDLGLVGASSVHQLEQNIEALQNLDFDDSELEEIDRLAVDGQVNIWASSSEA